MFANTCLFIFERYLSWIQYFWTIFSFSQNFPKCFGNHCCMKFKATVAYFLFLPGTPEEVFFSFLKFSNNQHISLCWSLYFIFPGAEYFLICKFELLHVWVVVLDLWIYFVLHFWGYIIQNPSLYLYCGLASSFKSIISSLTALLWLFPLHLL